MTARNVHQLACVSSFTLSQRHPKRNHSLHTQAEQHNYKKRGLYLQLPVFQLPSVELWEKFTILSSVTYPSFKWVGTAPIRAALMRGGEGRGNPFPFFLCFRLPVSSLSSLLAPPCVAKREKQKEARLKRERRLRNTCGVRLRLFLYASGTYSEDYMRYRYIK